MHTCAHMGNYSACPLLSKAFVCSRLYISESSHKTTLILDFFTYKRKIYNYIIVKTKDDKYFDLEIGLHLKNLNLFVPGHKIERLSSKKLDDLLIKISHSFLSR